jgi:hypothetical protein
MISRRLRHGISFQDHCYLVGAERGAAEGLLRGLIDGIVGSWATFVSSMGLRRLGMTDLLPHEVGVKAGQFLAHNGA